MKAVIAGGGIGGLTAALALHRFGIDVEVFESTDRIEPLGVGINLLPHAVRELETLGVLDRIARAGLAPTKLAYFTKRGEEIWDEPRGIAAGYQWPQVSVHRGELQKALYDAVLDRVGIGHVHLGCHLAEFSQQPTLANVRATFADRRTGAKRADATGDVLIASDGIHSAARRHYYPNEGPPKWNGSKLWRGLTEAPMVLDGRTMVWCGHRKQKFIAYPLRDLPNGRQLVNFIAELQFDNQELSEQEDWNRPGVLEDFLPPFEGWVFDWLDVPALLRGAPGTFVFPMVDRDPVDRWTHDRVTLLGDAAHPMYPIGSNGASQAILDALTLAGCLRSFGNDAVGALARYDEIRRPATGAIVLANRGMGPELPMQLVEERAPDGFANLSDVITPDEVVAATDGYRRTAGFALDALNGKPSLADLDYTSESSATRPGREKP
jgi:5-methylphenazine-1-carboxylate 1-monooxygenase